MLDFECVLNTGMNHKDLLMTLQIETCFRSVPSLYSEVYQLPDGTGILYWVFALKSNKLLQIIHDYSNKHKLPQNLGLNFDNHSNYEQLIGKSIDTAIKMRDVFKIFICNP